MQRLHSIGLTFVSVLVAAVVGTSAGCGASTSTPGDGVVAERNPFVLVLGIGQDGGVPQTGSLADDRWDHRLQVSSLAVVDPESRQYWIFDATPDFPMQMRAAALSVPGDTLRLGGLFLTHAHIGHYTGLMYLGHESMGANNIRTYAMDRMADFITNNGPWSQLVRYKNISLVRLKADSTVTLNSRISVKPILVPHRQEFSEVVGFQVIGPARSVLFIPDIDSWADLDTMDVSIESLVHEVDRAFLDGTFFENGEIPGRDMSGFPHPFISKSIRRFAPLPTEQRTKISFIHLNHSNPALRLSSPQRAEVAEAGMAVAIQGERVSLVRSSSN